MKLVFQTGCLCLVVYFSDRCRAHCCQPLDEILQDISKFAGDTQIDDILSKITEGP